ncbi:LuxR C-terminal-related transcriptional regulator, partial [Patulibacter sp. S7RM1-6]
LVRRGRRLLEEADALLGAGRGPADEPPHELDRLLAELDVAAAEIVERLRAGDGGELGALGTALVEIQTFRGQAHEHGHEERRTRLEALEAGLAPLRWIHDPRELLARACEAVTASCGFDRALLSRVEGSVWRPWKSHAVGDREAEQRFRGWMTTTPEIPLDHLLLESELIRRHAPGLVTDADEDPRVYRPLVEASGLRSYVAAPLMPTGRVIGFLHADHETGAVTPLDRDVLWAFAEAFGHVFERAVLLTRLREQREHVGRAMASVAEALDDLASAELDLGGRSREHGTSAVPRLPPGPSPTPGSRIASLLTPRELEVLALMATGATNARIAEQLVISDGTVKSHVKRILRKLRAANRAEAIARYLRLTMGRDPAVTPSRRGAAGTRSARGTPTARRRPRRRSSPGTPPR